MRTPDDDQQFVRSIMTTSFGYLLGARHHHQRVQAGQKIIYIPLDDARLTALAQASEETSRSVEQLVQSAVSEFLREKREHS